MKIAVIISVFLLFAIGKTSAQVKPVVEKPKFGNRPKTAPSKTLPVAPAPAPVEKTPATTSDPLVYSLTSVRVKIKTGNDNKEFPSNVTVSLRTKNAPGNQPNPFIQFALSNEMRINTETEFGLERNTQGNPEAGLAAFQAQGLRLMVRYSPNFFMDAWKIENLSVVLEFKDQHGNLHPTLGSKTVVFTNAYGFLNNDYIFMECTTDGNFSPLTAVIRKQ